MSKAVVITVSDSCARGARQDISGPAVAEALGHAGFDVVSQVIVPDEKAEIETLLREAAAQAPLVVTTGGTGITARDVTPEATRAVCDRLLDGLAEQMRSEGRRETPFAVLSRGVCGLLGASLVVNLPGSPRGAVTSLGAILPVVPHALGLLADAGAEHPDVGTGATLEAAQQTGPEPAEHSDLERPERGERHTHAIQHAGAEPTLSANQGEHSEPAGAA